MIPTVDFLGFPASRLTLGDNPFCGHSYVHHIHSGGEMMDYYTADNCVRTLFEAEELGINTYIALADPFVLRVIRQYRNAGGTMNVLFQSYPAIELEINLHMMMACEPVAIYHQGGTADLMVESEETDRLKSRLQMIREAGVPVGLGTHEPETVLRAEAEGWGADFYMTCLYNARKQQRGQQSGFITGKPKELVFYPDDRFLMFDAIRQVPKPCIAFKVFAGGQMFIDKTDDEIATILDATFREVYSSIKPGDLACIGVFQKNRDELRQDAEVVSRIFETAEKG